MAGAVKLNNGLTYSAGSTDILNGYLADIIDQDKMSFEYAKNIKSDMLFTDVKVTNPSQTFTEQVGAEELDEINEGQNLPVIDVSKGANKGFELKKRGGKLFVTDYFMKWLERNETIDTADSRIQEYYTTLAQATVNLNYGAQKSQTMEMVKLLTRGWVSTSAYGPGSATAYGQALFSASHSIKNGTSSFSNLLDGSGQTANKVLSATSLQWALDNLKTRTRLQNGDFVDNPSGAYELRVPRALEQTARAILQDNGKQPMSMYAGTGSNANLLNTFYFAGNTVKLKVLPRIGSTDKDGTVIGATTYWFVVNPDTIRQSKAFKYISLMEPKIETRYNEDNKNYYASIHMYACVEHIGAQYGIVGSQGTQA